MEETKPATPAVPAKVAQVAKTPPKDTTTERVEIPEGHVIAVVPKPFRLTHDDHSITEYKAGTQTIPKEHAEHWWAKAHGVEIFKG